jgi:hypothetical protein
MVVRQLANPSPVTQPVQSLLLDKSIVLKKSGLLFSRNPSLWSWECAGEQLLTFADSSTWWIADWLAYGEAAFQDRYREAIKKTSLHYQTLRNYVWVARQFELSRRRDNLSFCHHAEVAALDRPEQEFWLRKAEELAWSRNQLREQVRASLRERRSQLTSVPDGGGSPAERQRLVHQASPQLCLRLARDQIALWTIAAESQNMRLDDWAIQVLDAAARGEGLR